MYVSQVSEADVRALSTCSKSRCDCTTANGNVHCPLHSDTEPSMSVKAEGDKLLLLCFGGCDTRSILAHYRAIVPKKYQRREAKYTRGLTIDLFSKEKQIRVTTLRENYIREIEHYMSPALSFDYIDEHGKKIATRIRLSIDGPRKFIWGKGSRAKEAALYGRWKMSDAYEKGYVFLCEGESDCLTLWDNNEPAVGLPGVSVWQEDIISDLLMDERIKKVYAFIEPDVGGEKMLKNLQSSKINSKVELVFANRFDDFSTMYMEEPTEFVDNIQHAKESACGWLEYERVAFLLDYLMEPKLESMLKLHLSRQKESTQRLQVNGNFWTTGRYASKSSNVRRLGSDAK